MPLARNQGLLAFIWDVYTNKTKATRFKKNPDAFMAKYGLTPAELKAVWATGLDPKHPANRKAALSIRKTGKAGQIDVKQLEDRKKPDTKTMAKLCGLLVAHLTAPGPFDDAW